MNDKPSSNPNNGQSNPQNGNGNQPKSDLVPTQGAVALQQPDGESAVAKQAGSSNEMAAQNAFDQPIILRQPSYWSRAIMLTIMGVTSFSLLAAFIFKVEEAIPAQGKLEPEGAVQEVQAPAGGVVKEILVEDGDNVVKGETLIRLDPVVSEAELGSLISIYNSTGLENDFFKAEIYNQELPSPEELAELEIPPYFANLTLELRELKQREVVFNNYMGYLNQLAIQPVRPAYTGQLQELASAVWQQYFQVAQQIRGTELQLQQIEGRLQIEEGRIAIAEQSRQIEEDIVGSISPLVEQGALARIQLQRQQSELLTRQNEVEARTSEFGGLAQQQTALVAELLSAREQQQGIVASAQAEARSRLDTIVDRKQQITSDLNSRIIANNNRMSELEAQIQQAQTQLEYQEIKAPIDGVVFDVQPQVQGVVNPNAVEPVLKVVPSDALVAKVFLQNRDVGFVLKAMEEKGNTEEGVTVDVRIDSFPFNEFQDVEGRVVWVGDDALPPDQVYNFFRFPAKIELEKQFIVVEGAPVSLQSGMSVSVNIKTRKRRIITLFTNLFVRRVEKLRER